MALRVSSVAPEAFGSVPLVANHEVAVMGSAGLPDDFIGVVSDDAFANGPAYRDATLRRERSAGVQLIRREFDWGNIESAPGRYDFTSTDADVAAAAGHGLRLMPILFDTPAFYSSAPKHAARGVYPPRHLADFSRFAAAAVKRYGPGGTFWKDNPQVPALPIHHWQIWNEPNIPAYWASGPDPAQYAAMLRGAARAIRGVEPHADIITAGIPDSRLGIPYLQFIRGLIAHGAASAFDTVGLNPYAPNGHQLLARVAGVRALLSSHHVRARIWVTELGWANSGSGHTNLRVSTHQQARLVGQVVRAIARARRRLGLRGMVYYAWRDSAPYPPSFRDLWGLHTGLLTRSGEPKPAYAAFVAAATSLERG